jgi:vacuolar-type H+-ATPase subunit F/Vma7
MSRQHYPFDKEIVTGFKIKGLEHVQVATSTKTELENRDGDWIHTMTQ